MAALLVVEQQRRALVAGEVLVAPAEDRDEYLAGDEGPPLLLYHQECGHHASPTMVCSHCGEPLDPRKVTPEPGPGARVDTVSPL